MKNNKSPMAEGRIVKGIAGFYYIYVEDKGLYECKAKGLFRNKSIKPLIGDRVEIQILDEEKKAGNLEKVFERTNSLIRPAVANVDQAVVVFALASPEPHLNLLDRFLVKMQRQDIPVIIIFNKTDLIEADYCDRLCQIYEKAHYKTFAISAANEKGTEEVREALLGKTSVLAGPSGVGKSTLMNIMQPNALMQTGELSEKIQRGKNTTRHTELVYMCRNTYLIDSPGFSSLYIDEIEAGDLYKYYPEFAEHEKNCRFAGCSHIKEPDCGIKEALKAGLIAKERYESYCKLYEEAADRRRY
jgi:ribosome biogenesis GTPase